MFDEKHQNVCCYVSVKNHLKNCAKFVWETNTSYKVCA